MKKGFALIVAVIFLVIVSSLGLGAFSLSTSTAKHTTSLYLKEQLDLALKGFAESTIQAILKNYQSSPGNLFCIDTIYGGASANLGYGINAIFKANIKYFTNGNKIGNCSSETVKYDYTDGTVVIDFYATYINKAPDINTPMSKSKYDSYSGDRDGLNPIRIHKRIVQKL